MSNAQNSHFISKTIKVTGMSCGSCEQAIMDELGALPGVSSVRPDHEKGSVKVTYDMMTIRLGNIEEKLVESGYPLECTFWSRAKRALAHFTEKNELSNLTHKSTCCNKPPLGG